jgi:hypothetical protein
MCGKVVEPSLTDGPLVDAPSLLPGSGLITKTNEAAQIPVTGASDNQVGHFSIEVDQPGILQRPGSAQVRMREPWQVVGLVDQQRQW